MDCNQIKPRQDLVQKATIHDTAAEISGNIAILWSRIALESIIRGSEVKAEFTLTEVFQKQGKDWKILALTLSSVRDMHEIKK